MHLPGCLSVSAVLTSGIPGPDPDPSLPGISLPTPGRVECDDAVSVSELKVTLELVVVYRSSPSPDPEKKLEESVVWWKELWVMETSGTSADIRELRLDEKSIVVSICVKVEVGMMVGLCSSFCMNVRSSLALAALPSVKSSSEAWASLVCVVESSRWDGCTVVVFPGNSVVFNEGKSWSMRNPSVAASRRTSSSSVWATTKRWKSTPITTDVYLRDLACGGNSPTLL